MGKRYHYTYRVKFPDQGWFYYGLHSTDDLDDGYSGSPVTHKDKWDLFAWEMEILEFHESREDAIEVENRILRHVFQLPECLNENAGGCFSLETCKKGGASGGTRITEKHITKNSEAQRKKSLKAKESLKWKEAHKKLIQHNIESGHLKRISQNSAQQRSKPIIAIFPDGSTKEYWGIREASRQLEDWKVNPTSIGRCAMGKQIQHQGLKFKFK